MALTGGMAMNTIPANINPAKPPAAQNRLGADLIALYLNRVETTAAGHFSICESLAPAGADLVALQSRRAELAGSVSRTDPREIVERIARLFMRFPSSRLPDDVAKATLSAYAQDLSGFPLWAIDRAFMAVISGQAGGSKAFVPSSLELRAACDKAMQPIRDEVADISKILDAETYREPTADEKARVAAQFRELVDELKLNVDPRDKAKGHRTLTKPEAQAALDRALADPQPAPAFSSSLRAKLGIQSEQREGEAA